VRFAGVRAALLEHGAEEVGGWERVQAGPGQGDEPREGWVNQRVMEHEVACAPRPGFGLMRWLGRCPDVAGR
jgi:hypothetical protein